MSSLDEGLTLKGAMSDDQNHHYVQDFVAGWFGGKKLDKARDAQLARIQAAVLYIANQFVDRVD